MPPEMQPWGLTHGSVGAILFDLDGTLTRPHLDFDAIRREIGLPTNPRTPVLEALERMTEQERARAQSILDRHEEEAARLSELQDGALEVLEAIQKLGIPTGVITRNSRRCADITLNRHGLNFHRVHTREDGPVKPSPEPVLAMCRHFRVPPQAAWMVGDYLFDIQSGNAAGAATILLIGRGERPEYADQARFVIRSLRELLPLLSFSTESAPW